MNIGLYQVLGDLGAGGMGSVSLARAPHGRLVVLKRALNNDPDLDMRLVDEARMGLRLRHPNIVETLECFEHNGRPVLALAYVSGTALSDLRNQGAVPTAAILRIGLHLSEALAAIHTVTDDFGAPLHMLHRDVTPANVLVGHDGNARLIDLGIARSVDARAQKTRTGFLRGTLRYLAPELFGDAPYSVASDLWSLGLILLELATGQRVFNIGDGPLIARIMHGQHPLGPFQNTLEPGLAHVLGGLLQRDPEQRFACAADAADVFRTFLTAWPDSQAATQNAVTNVAGPPRAGAPTVSEATEQLVRSAAHSFCAEAPQHRLDADIHSALTQLLCDASNSAEMVPSVSESAFEGTSGASVLVSSQGPFEIQPNTVPWDPVPWDPDSTERDVEHELTLAFAPPPPSAADHLASYINQLRNLEGDSSELIAPRLIHDSDL